jgi:hypothetical protein
MLIIDLHPTTLTSLLTTSVFVLALAILLAALTPWEPKDIIGATAACAAVLVVFVGTSTSDSNLGNGRTGGLIAGIIGGLYLLTMGVAYVRAGLLGRAISAARSQLARSWRKYRNRD